VLTGADGAIDPAAHDGRALGSRRLDAPARLAEGVAEFGQHERRGCVRAEPVDQLADDGRFSLGLTEASEPADGRQRLGIECPPGLAVEVVSSASFAGHGTQR